MKQLTLTITFIGLLVSISHGADDDVLIIKETTPVTTIDKMPMHRATRIMLCPGNKAIVIQGLRQPDLNDLAYNEMLFVVDAKTGKVTRTLEDEPTENVGPAYRKTNLTIGGKHVLYHGPRMRTIKRYSLEDGKTKTFECPEKSQGIWSFHMSTDGKSMMGVLARPPAAIRWDLATGKQIEYHPVVVDKDLKTRVHTGVKGTRLICIFSRGGKKRTTKFTFYDTKEKRVTSQKELPGMFLMGPWPDAESEQVMLFHQTSETDTSLGKIDMIDLKTLKTIRSVPLDTDIATMGLRRAGKDGRYLFMLSYLIQTVYVVDLQQGKLLGVVAPGGGGIASFDVAADGLQMVAMHGLWKQGALHATELSLVDLTPLFVKK